MTIIEMSNRLRLVLSEVRPNAVPLVDAFKFLDYLLNSSLGSYDGNVNKDMTDRAG